jgi:hypothetical protein
MEKRNERLRKELALFCQAFPDEEWEQIRPENPTNHQAVATKKPPHDPDQLLTPTGKRSFIVGSVPEGAKVFPLDEDF